MKGTSSAYSNIMEVLWTWDKFLNLLYIPLRPGISRLKIFIKTRRKEENE